MYIERPIDALLLEWKNSAVRKPLLLRGARQVGKSWAVEHLGETFDYFIEVNFEKRPEMLDVFQKIHDVHELAATLGMYYNTPVIPDRTLLFLDEIQKSADAIQSLWSFKEDYKELHVVAAGSLLEFALQDLPSFGVGRIRSLFVYPFSFDEFLVAEGKADWVKAKQEANTEKPLLTPLYNDLVQHFRTFLMVGGMPASVATWVTTHDYSQCQAELDDIQLTYYDDFPKYAKKVDPTLLRNTLQSVVMQIGDKFTYSEVDGGYRADDVKKALKLLCDAGIIKRVSYTSGNGLPLGAEVNDKFRKYIYLDSGLLLRILDLDFGGARQLTERIIAGTSEDLVNKGGLAEMVLGWELVKYNNPRMQHDLFYWENTAEGTRSEVDYIIARDLKVLPIECKAGTSGKMKSMYEFMHQKHLAEAIRCSLENFSELERIDKKDQDAVRHVQIVPLFAISNLFGE
ncbi:MAG: ATP-binding protein [Bacteroidales bacterium]|jgi:predicted AAA+ superfamily ATPase|nr:ATP-binding protein [Bacteroidales bacterium]